MTESVKSKNRILIRLTDERWTHITEEHAELAGLRLEVLDTIENPNCILEGYRGELLAIREQELGKFFIVVYRELISDGFIITAFITRKIGSIKKRKQLWP